MTSPVGTRRSPLSEFVAGAALVFRGFGLWARSPRLMLIGAIPALIVGIVYLVLLVLLLLNIDRIAVWITPFAEGWDPLWLVLVRVAAGLAVVVLGTFLLVRTYTALTLAVGDPFYERIWHDTEARLGDAPPDDDTGVWASIRRGVAGFLKLTALSLALGVVIFVLGLVPVVGTVLAAVLGAVTGGVVLTLELTGYAWDARRVPFGQRRRALFGDNRAKSLGFGVATYLLFLVPVVAVVAMPSAVVGATMLARETLGQPARLPVAPA